MDNKSIQSELASYTGKLLRDNFGKGPTSIFVSMEYPFISIYLREFLAPMERVLLRQKNVIKIEETRDLLMQELIPEIKATIRVIAGSYVESIYYDWSLKNRTGLLVGVMEENEAEFRQVHADYAEKEKVHQEIVKMSKKAEKAPEYVDSMYMNERTLIIERKGILVEIEKELIRSGFTESLRLSKRQLEKNLLDPDIFGSILNTSVRDIFVDWDFHKDRSYIIMILQPASK